MNGLIKGSDRAPIAQQTRLGWILSGSIQRKSFNCHVITNHLEDIAKYWEMEEIENTIALTQEDEFCEDFYKNTTRRLECGSYEVALPMKPGFESRLGTSKTKAMAQFKQLEHKFKKNQALAEDYKQFMDEYKQLGHMSKVCQLNHLPFYLPHHGVLRSESLTTKLRVVFNASAKSSSGHSLNDVMHRGPNLQKDLMTLILRWRQYPYVLTADVEKMFRTIKIREADQHLQRILWRDSPNSHEPLKEYNLTTVTYGTKAAPYLAMRTLQQLAKDDADKYPLAAPEVEQSFYMDDLLCGHYNLLIAKELRQQLISIMKGAGMNLRKWSSNTPELVNDLQADQLNSPFDFKCTETRKTLGLRWDSHSDTFMFQNKLKQDTKLCYTKRELLSEISKVFDPLGWLSPLTIKAKLLFQKTWSSNLSWDEKLPEELQNQWLQLRNDFINIQQFKIHRYLGDVLHNYKIHCFCDASEKAYACVIYVVTSNYKGECTSNIVAGKTKLAPLKKKISLPRLELCGALLATQLLKKVLNSIPHENSTVYAWTDSMVVLGWIHGNPNKWNKFVASRVQQITDIIPASQWHHVKSDENAADCATRGLSASKLASSLSTWWKGPSWLLNFTPDVILKPYVEPDLEIKKTQISAVVQFSNESIIKHLLCVHSSITRIAKVVAWVSRFISKCKDRKNALSSGSLTSGELCQAYDIIVKHEQIIYFENEINDLRKKGHIKSNSNLACLNPFLDENYVLRVGGRLKHSTLSNRAKHPIILPKHSRFTELVIDQAHLTTLHGGPKLTLGYLRDQYWIVSGVSTVKKQLRKCVKCRRFNQSNQHQIMADLPHARVTPSRPFTHTGVDFTGHVDVKCNKGRGVRTTKGYIAVFVCMSTKAVHLELVSDLSTQAFLAAFRRFCARRGTPKHMYSDNGRNFIGADRLLNQEYKQILSSASKQFLQNISEVDVVWHFNAPAWPTAGGLWEAAVKSLKYHLKRVIGEQKLTYEEFITLLQQIEACLNSRPLCRLTEEHEDECLTPGHFLVGGALMSRPQAETENISLTQRWQLVQAMNKEFWKHWSSEYLQNLQMRSKWKTHTENMKLDDVVLIKEDNMPPGKWAMGRIIQLHPGSDGYVRVVSIKTQNSIMKRPISKLVLLPIMDQKQQTSEKCNKVPTECSSSPPHPPRLRPRRGIKNILSYALFLIILIITPSMQQNQVPYNITKLQTNQGLLFDKISDLQFIRDEWKLVVYYNMSTYWSGMSSLKNYVSHIKSLCDNPNSQLNGVATQLEHEINEIDHYNYLLTPLKTKRQKRGFINGVGYLANSLFGVLDDRFAQKYEEDIEKISLNENHLQNLIKNQTLVLEAEYNILKRNEDVMSTQFKFIEQHLYNLTLNIDKVTLDYKNAYYIMSSALAADIIISNIRRIQQVLIDTVADISQGHIDTHLLSPDQLKKQLFTITAHLQSDLTVPVDILNLKDLYKLLKVSAKVMESYLIMEIKVPIISNEIFELHKIISIPQKRGNLMYQAIPASEYLAYNTKQDKTSLLSRTDLQSCFHLSEIKLYCSLDSPLYNLKSMQSICDIKLVDHKNTSPCNVETSACSDKWIKLHARNAWLFSCCENCSVRIFGTAGWKVETLNGNGVITLGQGCTLMGESFTIFGHNNYLSNLHTQQNLNVPNVSPINQIINTSIPIPDNFESAIKYDDWQKLKEQINAIKEQSSTTLSVHDVHHYSVLYTIVAVLLLSGIIAAGLWIRLRRQRRVQAPAQAQVAPAASVPLPKPRSSFSDVKVISARSEMSLDKSTSTSPAVTRPVKFIVQSDSE